MNEQNHLANGFTGQRQACRLAMAGLTALLLQIAGNTEANAANPFTEGVEAYGAQNYNLALTKLAAHLRKNPSDADAHYYLAATYTAMKRTAEAKRQYEYIISAFPNSQAAKYSAQALASASASAAQGNSSGSAGTSATPAKPVAQFKDPDEDRVPLRRSTGGHLMVQVKVNGKNAEFAFDTGASQTCITTEAWQRLGNPAPTEPPTGFTSGVGGRVGTWTREAEIQLGGFNRTLPLTILTSMPFDGLIGQTFFQELQYNLSGTADYIHIFSKGSKTAGRSIPMDTIDIPFTKLGNNLLVTAKINGLELPMLFDTGATNTLVGARTAAMLGLRPTGEYMVGSMGGVGANSPVIEFNVDSIALGDVVKRNVLIWVGGSGACLLGQNFFKDRRYVIDNEKKLIRFFR
jgi:predicted aspartyl protease